MSLSRLRDLQSKTRAWRPNPFDDLGVITACWRPRFPARVLAARVAIAI